MNVTPRQTVKFRIPQDRLCCPIVRHAAWLFVMQGRGQLYAKADRQHSTGRESEYASAFPGKFYTKQI